MEKPGVGAELRIAPSLTRGVLLSTPVESRGPSLTLRVPIGQQNSAYLGI